VNDIKRAFPDLEIFAPLKNKAQIPQATRFVSDGDILSASSFQFRVMELPGHTLGHIAYWEESQHWLFSGDVLFGLGCGRLFEGTFEQMFQSLAKIAALPADTLIYCTHEYTETNLRFCKALSRMDMSATPSDNDDFLEYETELLKVRAEGQASVPLRLEKEKKANPFLMARSLKEFTSLRELRNKF